MNETHDGSDATNEQAAEEVKPYAKLIPFISPATEAAILARIKKRDDGIWEWIPKRDKFHRARIKLPGIRAPFQINRLMWVIRQRITIPDYQIPEWICVCHKYDVTPELYDCNPDNLWLGTRADNTKDRDAKGRQAKGDTSGPRLHPERMRRGDNHPFRLHPEVCPRGDRNGSRTKPESRPRGDGHWARLKPESLCRGDEHGMRIHAPKLTMDKANEIRALYSAGAGSLSELGNRFGVSFQHVSDIINNKRWAI